MTTCKLPVRTTFTALTLLLATACGDHFGGAADDAAASAPGQGPGQSSSDPDAGPKAPPVTGTPAPDDITEAQGIFVSPNGSDTNAGTRAAPFATMQAAIAGAAKVGKIVYACTGTYAEALVVADSISLIGGLDCSDPASWKTGAAPSKILSPTSPAVTAKAIVSATRLESLDIVAPDATAPGASSIGLFANYSPALTVASSKITAGNGARGTDGPDGVALSLGASVVGADSTQVIGCIPYGNRCGYTSVTTMYGEQPSPPGGVGQCTGAGGKNGAPGGAGGGGGHAAIYQSGTLSGSTFWVLYGQPSQIYVPGLGVLESGAAGSAGNDATAGVEFGRLTSDGYVPQDGNPGTDGQPGSGGSGGDAGFQIDLPAPNMAGLVYTGLGGPGGGAGGCAGLAGGPGTGGGASFGVALVASPITLDDVAVRSGTGGTAGLGSFGSNPTVGGAPGNNSGSSKPAMPGGNGGVAGVSTNGSNGPSVGIVISGAAPMLTGTTKAAPGDAAPAIDARTKSDDFGTRTIPATPVGIAVDVKTL